jgi:hypothetical protein
VCLQSDVAIISIHDTFQAKKAQNKKGTNKNADAQAPAFESSQQE